LRRLELGFRVDDLGPPIAFRLGLLGDGLHHVVRQLDRSDLDIAQARLYSRSIFMVAVTKMKATMTMIGVRTTWLSAF
jgi:hypothetical protein